LAYHKYDCIQSKAYFLTYFFLNQHFGLLQLIRPEEMINPKVDDLSMMTYLAQYPNAKVRAGAPLRQRVNVQRVRCYGKGIEPTGNHVDAPAKFFVETANAGKGDIDVIVINPKGQKEPVSPLLSSKTNQYP
jgi:filamin